MNGPTSLKAFKSEKDTEQIEIEAEDLYESRVLSLESLECVNDGLVEPEEALEQVRVRRSPDLYPIR